VPEPLRIRALRWPEIGSGADLVALLCETGDLRDGDVVVVTSKVIAKAEGRTVQASRERAVESETRRVVARRGGVAIAETRHGFVMAAAGVDASNTPAGTAVLLPIDPDASARALRDGAYGAVGVNVAVVVSDTMGRAWRSGQIDLAVGCAGLMPLLDLRGTRDTHGNELLVTAPALADAVAAAADLVKGKTSGCPVAVIRGLDARVLPPGTSGPGARSLVRPAGEDLFGLGSREAVAAAVLRRDSEALDRFPRRAAADDDPFTGLITDQPGSALVTPPGLRASLAVGVCASAPADPTWSLRVAVPLPLEADVAVTAGRLLERADALAAAHRLRWHDHEGVAEPGWHQVAARCWWDG
jgi:coenzyme F420-0:L-glutamate ligase/coenzyme F420-1:gamma-L-glutamate ligase